MKIFTVSSSNGSLDVDCNTGEVIEAYQEPKGDTIADIERFNIDEYKKHYGVTELPEDIDILDIGYTCLDGSYEPPSELWRSDVAILRAGEEL